MAFFNPSSKAILGSHSRKLDLKDVPDPKIRSCLRFGGKILLRELHNHALGSGRN